jgi:hypothetical protein
MIGDRDKCLQSGMVSWNGYEHEVKRSPTDVPFYVCRMNMWPSRYVSQSWSLLSKNSPLNLPKECSSLSRSDRCNTFFLLIYLMLPLSFFVTLLMHLFWLPLFWFAIYWIKKYLPKNQCFVSNVGKYSPFVCVCVCGNFVTFVFWAMPTTYSGRENQKSSSAKSRRSLYAGIFAKCGWNLTFKKTQRFWAPNFFVKNWPCFSKPKWITHLQISHEVWCTLSLSSATKNKVLLCYMRPWALQQALKRVTDWKATVTNPPFLASFYS